MAESSKQRILTAELWRNALRENERYYRRVGTLYARHLQDLASVFTSNTKPLTVRIPKPTTTRTKPEPQAVDAPSPAVIVLEGGAGDIAAGAFVVENHLPHPAEATVVSSAFTDAVGTSLTPKIQFEPGRFTLEPGSQVVVRTIATIPADAEPGVAYDGHFSVPNIPGGPVHVRLRRTEHAADPSA